RSFATASFTSGDQRVTGHGSLELITQGRTRRLRAAEEQALRVVSNRPVFRAQELVRAFAIPGDEEVLQTDVATLGIGGARLQDVEQAHPLREDRFQDLQLLDVDELKRLYSWVGQHSLTR